MKTSRLLLIPAVLSGLLAAPGARAATLTWEGDDSGDWATGTNWADGSAPAGNSGTPDVLNFGTVPAGGTKTTNNNLTGDRHFNQLNTLGISLDGGTLVGGG